MKTYNSCFEALTQEFDFYDEEAEKLLKSLPQLEDASYWLNYRDNIMKSIEIALWFGNTQEQIIQNPGFVVIPPKDLISKAALKILSTPQNEVPVINTWVLSHKMFYKATAATMNAILEGDLPAGYDIYSHTDTTEKYLGLESREFITKYMPEMSAYDFIMQNLQKYRAYDYQTISQNFPEFFPQSTQEAQIEEVHKEQEAAHIQAPSPIENKTSVAPNTHTKTEPQSPKQTLETYAQICNMYNIAPQVLKARLDFIRKQFPTVNMNNIQRYLLDSNNLIACSEQDILDAKEQIQTILHATNEQVCCFVKQSTNFPYLNFEQLQESFELLQKYNLPTKVANYHPTIYTIPTDELEKRIKLAYIFNVSSTDFLTKFYHTPANIAIARSAQAKNDDNLYANIYASPSTYFERTGLTSDALLEKYPFSHESEKYIDEQFDLLEKTYGIFWSIKEHDFKRTRDGRTINDSLNSPQRKIINQKLAMLFDHGINFEDICPYSSILGCEISRLELRAKLAKLNNVDSKQFANHLFGFMESEIYALMMAQKNGELSKGISIYISSSRIKSLTGLDINELKQKYPLEDNAKKFIENEYQKLVEREKKKTQMQPNLDFSEKDQELFTTLKTFSSNQPDATLRELTDEKKSFLCRLFDLEETELAKLIRRKPQVSQLTPEIIEEKSAYLFDNYNLSYDDFRTGIKNNPYLATRTTKDYDNFFRFCDEYLLLDQRHAKKLLINHPNAIGTNPEDLIRKCSVIAQEMNVPFSTITERICEHPRVVSNALQSLAPKIQTALSLGIKREDLIENLDFLLTNPLDMRLKFMLNSLCEYSTQDLLSRNYLTSPEKVYARMMFNFEYDYSFPTGSSESRWALLMHSLDDPKIPSELTKIAEPTEILMEMYPLDKTAMKQIEIMYNLQCPKHKMKFTQEEYDHERN